MKFEGSIEVPVNCNEDKLLMEAYKKNMFVYLKTEFSVLILKFRVLFTGVHHTGKEFIHSYSLFSIN